MIKIMMQRISINIGAALFVTILMTLAVMSQQAWAVEKKVDNKEAVDFLTECMLADDAIDDNAGGKYICCSEKLFFCIECPESPSENCTLTPNSKPGENPLLIQTINPNALSPSKHTAPRTIPLDVLKNYIRRNKAKENETGAGSYSKE